jgi:hypothetical protein
MKKKVVEGKETGLKYDDHDISFCLNTKCGRIDCERHYSHTDRGIIYCFSKWEPVNGKCEGYLGE